METLEKDTIKNLAEPGLTSLYPEVFAMGVELNRNFWILIQIILRNQKQDLETCLHLATKVIKEMVAMSMPQREVLEKLLTKHLFMVDEKENPGKEDGPLRAYD